MPVSILNSVQQPTNQRAGTNQNGVKHYNERLILDIVAQSQSPGQKQEQPPSKADIARITGLSAQTVTVIVNRLIDEGYLLKLPVVKGKIGQPSTPLALNPDGAISIGVKLGRRSVDVLTMSFTNHIIQQKSLDYPYPDSDVVLPWIKKTVTELTAALTPYQRQRVMGIGLAAPFHLDAWEAMIGAPQGSMQKWKNINIRSYIATATGLPTFLLNDASAACLAELRLYQHHTNQSFLYFYIGTFLGGGIVINGQLYNGIGGNSGSVGSLPQQYYQEGNGTPDQMVTKVATHKLESMLSDRSQKRISVANSTLNNQQLRVFEEWAEEAANFLAFSLISGQSFLDVNLVIIDGLLAPDLLNKFIAKVKLALNNYDLQGLIMPDIKPGHLGNTARAIGGAMLPFHENFAVDNSVILK